MGLDNSFSEPLRSVLFCLSGPWVQATGLDKSISEPLGPGLFCLSSPRVQATVLDKSISGPLGPVLCVLFVPGLRARGLWFATGELFGRLLATILLVLLDICLRETKSATSIHGPSVPLYFPSKDSLKFFGLKCILSNTKLPLQGCCINEVSLEGLFPKYCLF